MFLAHKPTESLSVPQMSVRSVRPAPRPSLGTLMAEDGCTVPRPALGMRDPAVWCTATILGAAVVWLMS